MNSQLQNKVVGSVDLCPDLPKGRTASGKASCNKMLKCWSVIAEALTHLQGVVSSTGTLAASDSARQAALFVKPCQAVLMCLLVLKKSLLKCLSKD